MDAAKLVRINGGFQVPSALAIWGGTTNDIAGGEASQVAGGDKSSAFTIVYYQNEDLID
jgi:hypothetical protein